MRASQRERHLISAALHRGKAPVWDHQPQVDASLQYVRNRDDLYALQRRARLDSGDPDRLSRSNPRWVEGHEVTGPQVPSTGGERRGHYRPKGATADAGDGG